MGNDEALPSSWAASLRQHARDREITKEEATPLGTRFLVEGDMTMPDGAVVGVHTIRSIEHGKLMPRLATACPLKRKKQV